MAINHTSSGREMNKYPKTKSDPICKWRTASLGTVVELVKYLPKTRMAKEKFREHMTRNYPGDFFHTPYQLAAQLGLYCENENEYIPRFKHNITENEALGYMQKWMQRYYVPNPYTKQGFIDIVPSINLLYSLINYLDEHPYKRNLATAGAALFGGEMGNIGCVKYVLNNYSDMIKVNSSNEMTLSCAKSGKIYVNKRRDDKKAFFEHFN